MQTLDIDSSILDEMSEEEVKSYLKAKYAEYSEQIYAIIVLNYKNNGSMSE